VPLIHEGFLSEEVEGKPMVDQLTHAHLENAESEWFAVHGTWVQMSENCITIIIILN